MIKLTTKVDCKNAPKKASLRDFNRHFVAGDVDAIMAKVCEDIRWEIVGDQVIEGWEPFQTALAQMTNVAIAELIIHQIITHGREAAANGEIVMQDGTRVAFCDIYEFRGLKEPRIKAMRSYIVPLNEGSVA